MLRNVVEPSVRFCFTTVLGVIAGRGVLTVEEDDDVAIVALLRRLAGSESSETPLLEPESRFCEVETTLFLESNVSDSSSLYDFARLPGVLERNAAVEAGWDIRDGVGLGLAVGVGEAGSPELVTSGRFFRGDLTTSAAIRGTSSRLDLTSVRCS